ncbi:UDP-N-acetylmuramoyl-L-alanine--D-glutamate ligase [Gracilinema caldarium]|uniref:UDP-N-acetylmuramoylalanine--D-glutamate ligase n=1 Tax=Gracilinema caldarium (strain ATCC 51460 / DSM 7334 / H1) TaxID=744872 RepID=F8F2L3_GRAC1|nr:UDP-N-acetylmuramoyl-L-alanine--D-glutamate ligase [Gracilinema caldarium]AEJ19128.1 UDP-N-acetylmuramoylalanine/D-glutamate ligase [Gracilinema caldarium DSM 7334]
MNSKFSGSRVVVMGLGLNGGGLEAARYLATHGAQVTVTDLRDEKVLRPSIEALADLPIRFVLGKHEIDDFRSADMVVKNPAVRPDSPYLAAAQRIETDISLFLQENPARLCAVTGSKGKSSTSSALHWVLSSVRNKVSAMGMDLPKAPQVSHSANPHENSGSVSHHSFLPGKAYLGGNITVSPLIFLDQLTPEDDVVLELSSWQLGDLRARRVSLQDHEGTAEALDTGATRALLKPRVAILTTILPDHLDRYGTMEAYVADKKVIYQGQDKTDVTIVGSDSWGGLFSRESPGRPRTYQTWGTDQAVSQEALDGWLAGPQGPGLARLSDGSIVEVVPERTLVPGIHQKQNLLACALGLLDLGLPPEMIRETLATFPGLEHRLEFFFETKGIRFYNDTAATIPEAAAAAIEAFETGPILVTGGTDKNLDFSPLAQACKRAKQVILLAGTGTEKLLQLLNTYGISYRGPYDNLDKAVLSALEAAITGDNVVLSPGCASFGMFLNEFDRGRKWKEAVQRLA